MDFEYEGGLMHSTIYATAGDTHCFVMNCCSVILDKYKALHATVD